MERRELEIEVREGKGKSFTRKLRRDGAIPGIFYGPDIESVSIVLDPKSLREAISTSSGMNTILDIKSKSKDLDGRTAMLKDYQENPLKSGFIHADLMAVEIDKPIRVEVPIELHGTPEGVTLGGTLDQMLWEIEIECLPLDMPDQVDVNVSHLAIGQSVHVSDLKLKESITLFTDVELPVATVLAPRVEEVAAPTEGEEAEAAAEAKPEEAGEKPEKTKETEKTEDKPKKN